jgi:hypothetical protein
MTHKKALTRCWQHALERPSLQNPEPIIHKLPRLQCPVRAAENRPWYQFLNTTVSLVFLRHLLVGQISIWHRLVLPLSLLWSQSL